MAFFLTPDQTRPWNTGVPIYPFATRFLEPFWEKDKYLKIGQANKDLLISMARVQLVPKTLP